MPLRSSPYGYWGSPGRFVLAVLGIVVGLGNLWRLPSLIADNGGSAYLLVYLISLCGLAAPLLINEWVLGRWMRSNMVWGLRHLSRAGQVGRGWQLLGWTALLAAALVLNSALLAPFGLTAIAVGYLALSALIMLSSTALLLPPRSATTKALS